MSEVDMKKLSDRVASFRLPRFEQLPDVGLYLEQVVNYVNRYIYVDQEHKITASMVSNYVKQKIIPGPSKKLYGKDAIAVLIFVSYTKIVVPLEDIKFMIGVQNSSYDINIAYDYFCDELENLMQYVFGLKAAPDRVGHDDTVEKELMRSALLSITYKIYLEQYIKVLKED